MQSCPFCVHIHKNLPAQGNNKNTGARCEVCSKLIINNQNDAWRLSGVFIVYFEHVPHLVLVFLLLT